MFVVLLADPSSADGTAASVQAAVVVASAVPAIGASVMARSPIRNILTRASARDLKINAVMSLSLRIAALGAFVTGIVLMVAGHDTTAEGIFTAISGGTLGTVSLLVDRGQERSARQANRLDVLETEDNLVLANLQVLELAVMHMKDQEKLDHLLYAAGTKAADAVTSGMRRAKQFSGGNLPVRSGGSGQTIPDPGKPIPAQVEAGTDHESGSNAPVAEEGQPT